MVVSEAVIDCAVVGDGMIGKSCLVQTFVGQKLPRKYMATILEHYIAPAYLYGEKYHIAITDFAGEHESNNLKALNRRDGKVFLVCYSAVDRESFNSVKSFWVPTIKALNKKHQILLVATQIDLRKSENSNHVTFKEGVELCKQINGDDFMECTIRNKYNIKEVFENVVSTSIKQRKRKPGRIKKIFAR